VGIPVFVVLSVLGFVGIKSWYDITAIQDHLTDRFNTVSADIDKKKDVAEQHIKSILTEADSFRHQIDAAKPLLAAVPQLQLGQEKLTSEVQRLTNFVNNGGIIPEALSKMDKSVNDYKSYLITIGMNLPINVPRIRGGGEDDTYGTVGYYDSMANQIVINKRFSEDTSVILREYTHYFLLNQGDKSNTEKALAAPAVESML
jgi:hypothetical protein